MADHEMDESEGPQNRTSRPIDLVTHRVRVHAPGASSSTKLHLRNVPEQEHEGIEHPILRRSGDVPTDPSARLLPIEAQEPFDSTYVRLFRPGGVVLCEVRTGNPENVRNLTVARAGRSTV